MTNLLRLVAALPAASAALIAAAPLAAEDPEGKSACVKALRDCQSKADPAQRLASCRTPVAAMVSASNEGEVRVADRAEVRETRRKLFGFSLPDFGIFGGKSDKERRVQ